MNQTVSIKAGIAVCSLFWAVTEGTAREEFRQFPGRSLSAAFQCRNAEGEAVEFQKLLTSNVPVILVPGFFRCEHSCEDVRKGLAMAFRQSRLEPGKDVRLIFLSLNAAEPISLARTKQREWLEMYGGGTGRQGVQFVTGPDWNMAALARQIGFEYRYDKASGEYKHPAGCVVLTPQGKISRYVMGVNFSPRELEAAVETASGGRVGETMGSSGIICPEGTWWARMARSLIQIAGIGLIGGLLYSMVQGRRNLQKG